MIWGKTRKQQILDVQAYLRELQKDPWVCWFAWRPVKLQDGRFLWAQRYYEKRDLIEDKETGELYNRGFGPMGFVGFYSKIPDDEMEKYYGKTKGMHVPHNGR